MPEFIVETDDGRKFRVEADTPEDIQREFVAPPVLPDRPAPGIMETADVTMRAGARGLPFVGSYMDEASAALNTGAGLWGDYEKSLEAERLRDFQDRRDFPVLTGAAEFGGGILGTLAGLRWLGGVAPGVAGPEAMAKVAAMSRPAKFATAMGVGGGAGAAEGAISGFGEGEGDVGARLARAVDNAQMGGAVGAASPVVGMLAAKAAPGVTSLARKAFGSDTLNDRIRGLVDALGIDPKAVKDYLEVAKADDVLSPTGRGRRNIERAGKGAIVMDAGPNFQGVADYAMQRGGEGAGIVSKAIEKRVGESGQAVTGAFDEAFGEPVGKAIRERAKRAAEAPEIKELYDTAYKRIFSSDKELRDLVMRAPKSAQDYARQLLKTERGKDVKDLTKSVEGLDYLTRALNEVPENQGKLGKLTTQGRANTNLARDIRSNIRAKVPDYDKALKAGQDAIEKKQALDLGFDLLGPGYTRAEAEIAIGDLGDRKSIIASGVGEYIDDKLARVRKQLASSTGDTSQLLKEVQELSTEDAKSKIAMLLPPKQIQNVFNRLAEAEHAIILKRGVAENSKTAARSSMAEAEKRRFQSAAKRLAEDVGTGGFQSPIVKTVGKALDRSPVGQERFERGIRRSRGEFLTRPATAGGPKGPFQDLSRLNTLTQMRENRDLAQKGRTLLATTPMGLISFFDTLKDNKPRNRGQD